MCLQRMSVRTSQGKEWCTESAVRRRLEKSEVSPLTDTTQVVNTTWVGPAHVFIQLVHRIYMWTDELAPAWTGPV